AVLLNPAEKMPMFFDARTKSLRAGLTPAPRHAWSDSCSGRKAVVATGGSQAQELLHTVEAREDLVRRLEEEFDRELLDEAMARVKTRVLPRTWEAVERRAVEGQSRAARAHALRMRVATVFVARSKVQKMLQEEMQQMEHTDPE